MGLGFTIGFIGVLILFHAAYSTIQCKHHSPKSIFILFYIFQFYLKIVVDLIADRTLLKITEEEFSGSPLSVSVFFYLVYLKN
jgi:hypothetical protein